VALEQSTKTNSAVVGVSAGDGADKTINQKRAVGVSGGGGACGDATVACGDATKPCGDATVACGDAVVGVSERNQWRLNNQPKQTQQ